MIGISMVFFNEVAVILAIIVGIVFSSLNLYVSFVEKIVFKIFTYGFLFACIGFVVAFVELFIKFIAFLF